MNMTYRSRTMWLCPLSLLFAGFCLIAVGSTQSLALEQTRLELEFWGPRSYLCNPNDDDGAFFVGGMYDIVVTILPDGESRFQVEYEGISAWVQPEGLAIRVAQSTDPNRQFLPANELLENLQLEYYITATQLMLDSIWQISQRPMPLLLNAPEYHFSIQIPQELADSYLCVSGEWNHPQYGYLASDGHICKKIVTPCSADAQHLVWTLQVQAATDQKKYEKAIMLADSFIVLGWHDLSGLLSAEIAAKNLGRFDDAVRFLDLCFESNQTILPSEGRIPGSPPTEADYRLYQEARSRLIEAQDQQR